MKHAALALALLAATLAPAATAEERSWDFEVRLDGTPIGTHRFALTTQGEERVMKISAAFTVKFLGFTAYRYQHDAAERWQGDCLARMDATTQDDGKPSRVQARKEPAGLAIEANGVAQPTEPACLMSFAYWHPALRASAPTRLLNAQTGRVETVQITRLADGRVDVRGTPQPAQRWRITGAEAPIELWYSPQGDWLGLDSTVRGGRALQYRLR